MPLILSLFPGMGVGAGVGVAVGLGVGAAVGVDVGVGIGVDGVGTVAIGAGVALSASVPMADPPRPPLVQAIRNAIAVGSRNQRIWLKASNERHLILPRRLGADKS